MSETAFTSNGRIRLPQPDELDKKEKEDAMGAYLMMFAAWGAGLPLPFLSFVAALIYHLINHKKTRFIGFHSFQSLLTETLISILNTVLVTWLVIILIPNGTYFTRPFFIYMWIVIFWNLVYTIISLVGCYKAKNGLFFYFPLFGKISYEHYYGRKAAEKLKNATVKKPENRPPGE